MADLIPEMNQALAELVPRLRLTLLNGKPAPRTDDLAGAIVSGATDIRIDSGRGLFAGRRRRLKLERRGAPISLLARLREPPRQLDPSTSIYRWAEDSRGRRYAVCALDRATRTMHLLVELTEGSSVRPTAGDPARRLVDALIADALHEFLDRAGDPRIGADVPSRVRELMAARPTERDRSYRYELNLLERFAQGQDLPGTLARRMRLLRDALVVPRGARARCPAGPEMVEREIERLTRLVQSRACAWLRFAPGRIEGLINPGELQSALRLYPRLFRLNLAATRPVPMLQIWSLNRPGPGGSGECLDGSKGVLDTLDRDADLYGLIDAVINFRETNHLGAIPMRYPPRGRWTGMRSGLL